jgi:hypothetical protein
MAVHRFAEHHNTIGGGQTSAEKEKLVKDVEAYRNEAERVRIDDDQWCSPTSVNLTDALCRRT